MVLERLTPCLAPLPCPVKKDEVFISLKGAKLLPPPGWDASIFVTFL